MSKFAFCFGIINLDRRGSLRVLAEERVSGRVVIIPCARRQWIYTFGVQERANGSRKVTGNEEHDVCFVRRLYINADIEEMEAPLSRQASYQPTAEDAAKGKALINFLMQDGLFLALLRSTDARVRAGAIDKLNAAHHQAYGDAR